MLYLWLLLATCASLDLVAMHFVHSLLLKQCSVCVVPLYICVGNAFLQMPSAQLNAIHSIPCTAVFSPFAMQLQRGNIGGRVSKRLT